MEALEKEIKRLIELKSGSVRAFALENDIPYTTLRYVLNNGIMGSNVSHVIKICQGLKIDVESLKTGDIKPITTGDVTGDQNFTGEISGAVTITNNDADMTGMEDGQATALKTQNALLKIQETGGDVRLGILETLVNIEKNQEQILAEVKKMTAAQRADIPTIYAKNEEQEELFQYQVYERLSAGNGTSTFDDLNYDTVYFDKDISHDIASWISGDSMEPTYQNGEVALIKETGFDYDGAVYAVVWDGQTYIKKVFKEEDGLRLVSLNDKYRDKFAPADEDPRVIGLVVSHFIPVER